MYIYFGLTFFYNFELSNFQPDIKLDLDQRIQNELHIMLP